jgi:hypothetical protein
MITEDYNEQSPQVIRQKKRLSLVLLSIDLGTLAPSFKLNSKSTIDLIFATYWIHSDTSTLLHADERACIDEGMAKEKDRLEPTNGKLRKSFIFPEFFFDFRRYFRNGS